MEHQGIESREVVEWWVIWVMGSFKFPNIFP